MRKSAAQTMDRYLLSSQRAWLNGQQFSPLQSLDQEPGPSNQQQHDRGRKHGHDKSADRKGVKRSKKDNKDKDKKKPRKSTMTIVNSVNRD